MTESGRITLFTKQVPSRSVVSPGTGIPGKPVLTLERVALGPVELDRTLPRGGSRLLTPRELRALEEASGGV